MEKTEQMENTGLGSIYDLLEKEIAESDLPEEEKRQRKSELNGIRDREVNILIAGATGVGKSSTINALFQMEVAKVGIGVDPETSDIKSFQLGNLTIWDTPGLGDGIAEDRKIKTQIMKKLDEKNRGNEALIDLALVLIDASTKDLGTTYELLREILIPCFDKDAENRIVVALNQADLAMKGKHWDSERNEPDEVLSAFLDKKAASVRTRIAEATGLLIEPVCFCAGYMETEDEAEKRRPYNLTKLLYHIVKAIPEDKRLALVDHLNKTDEHWKYDDRKDNYRKKTIEAFFAAVAESMGQYATKWGKAGEDLLGIPGLLAGGLLGGIVGAVKGACGAAFS